MSLVTSYLKDEQVCLSVLVSGSTEIRATSSLVLFDEDGKVVWEAP